MLVRRYSPANKGTACESGSDESCHDPGSQAPIRPPCIRRPTRDSSSNHPSCTGLLAAILPMRNASAADRPSSTAIEVVGKGGRLRDRSRRRRAAEPKLISPAEPLPRRPRFRDGTLAAAKLPAIDKTLWSRTFATRSGRRRSIPPDHDAVATGPAEARRDEGGDGRAVSLRLRPATTRPSRCLRCRKLRHRPRPNIEATGRS